MSQGPRRRNASVKHFRPKRITAAPSAPEDADGTFEGDPGQFIAFVQGLIDRPRFVYFIQEVDEAGYGAVKIGEAFDPSSRLRELQCGNSRTLELRAVIFATDETEATLHLAWRSVAGLRGEWFGRGFEHAIVELAQRAQRKQHHHFVQADMPGHWIAENGQWIVGHPSMLTAA